MYTICDYGNMYLDQARVNAYSTALRNAVTPDSVIVDIGTGTGIFALLACRFGARRVYAIEPSDAITLAREAAAANGYTDRIIFIQNLSTKVTLPERANAIISDLGGVLPLFGEHIPTIIDARDRFLVRGGALIPQQEQLRAAIVENSEQYDKLAEPWSENRWGLDLCTGWRLVANTWISLRSKKAKPLTHPSTLAVLDYGTITDSNMASEVVWTIEQPGIGHGAAVWSDRTVGDGITTSNQPDAPEAINTTATYGQGFFPWPNAVNLEPGDRIAFCMKTNLVKSAYVWRWETTICTGRHIKAHFRQSSLHGHPLSFETLRKREAECVPVPNEDARIDAFILSKIDGNTSLGQIARALAANFPSRFNGWQDALSRVGDVTAQYSANE
jgi:precorrin-6B methylase 2